MTVTVLSSNEKDLTKIVFAINQLAQGRSNAVWTTFTATLTPNAGSITTGGTSGYAQFGKLVFLDIAVTVSAISGGPASVTIAIPVAPKRSLALIGVEGINTGKGIACKIAASGTVSGSLVNASGVTSAPALNDEYVFKAVYEAA